MCRCGERLPPIPQRAGREALTAHSGFDHRVLLAVVQPATRAQCHTCQGQQPHDSSQGPVGGLSCQVAERDRVGGEAEEVVRDFTVIGQAGG